MGFDYFFDRILIHGLEFFGLYYGVYRAIVTSTDDPANDGQPDPQGRVRVRVPSVGDGEDVSRLAYPIVPLAGDGYGLKAIPPVDGHVYVVFENGRLDIPLWFGGWWARNHMPEDLAPLEAFGLVTPQGHKLILDGKSGQESIRVEHLNGAIVELDSQGSIFITNKSGQKVHVGNGADTANEPAALGNTLKGLLEQLCDACTSISVPTGTGPSVFPTNSPQFVSIKAQLQRFLSQTVNVK